MYTSYYNTKHKGDSICTIFDLRVTIAIQNGLDPSDWKPMNGVGIGVREIRIHVGGAWRVLYVAKFAQAV